MQIDRKPTLGGALGIASTGTVMRNPKWQGAVQAWLDAKTREEGPLPAHRTAMLHRIGAPEAASDESDRPRPSTAMASLHSRNVLPPRFERALIATRKFNAEQTDRDHPTAKVHFASTTPAAAADAIAEEEEEAAPAAPSLPTRMSHASSAMNESMVDHIRKASEADAKLANNVQNLYLTTYNVTMGLRELKGAGEVYQDVLTYCRPDRMESGNFKSAWGDSLKSGDMGVWRDTCLHTQYQLDARMANDRLKESSLQKRGRQRFLDWVKKSNLYYGELFDDATVEKVSTWLDTAPEDEQERFLTLMREIHSSLQPDRRLYKSHNTATYIKRANFGDTEINDLVAKYSRYMAFGFPKQVTLRPFSAPVRSSVSAPTAEGKKKGPKVCWKPTTLESSIQITQPEAAAHPLNSTYKTTFDRKSRRTRVFQQMAVKTADPWGMPTAPYGAPNPVTLGPSNLDVFAVPGHFANTASAGFGMGATPGTTYRHDYEDVLRDPARRSGHEAALRNQHQIQHMSRKITARSNIPLGTMGFQSMPTDGTTYQAHFIKRNSSAKENKEHADRLKEIAALPSIPVGTIAPNVPEAFMEARKTAKMRRQAAHSAR